jgi:hypothetical protein
VINTSKWVLSYSNTNLTHKSSKNLNTEIGVILEDEALAKNVQRAIEMNM